jgi:probable HAF family extracellular repeat protein
MNRNVAFVVLPAVSAALLSAASLCSAQSYTLTDLGVAAGARIYTGKAINKSGQIIGAAVPTGVSPTSDESDPYLLSSGTLTDIGTFGATNFSGQAYALNSLGEVVGLTATPDGGQAPFLFSNGTLTQLPNGGTPLSINTAGSIVGYFSPEPASPIDLTHAFVIQNGVFTDLGQGENFSEAHGINTSGQIAGDATDPNNTLTASVWQPDGTITFLGTLGGFESRAFAINDAGQVTGNSYTNDAQSSLHAFLFSNGEMTDIDTFGSDASWAFGINNNGVVVGQVAIPIETYNYHAFVFMGGSMMDLNTLIPGGSGLTLYEADGINDSGNIVGEAQSNSDGSAHGFLLTPVAPQITAISPTSGGAGTLVTITGKNFTKKPAACSVTFNGKVAKSTKWSDTQVQLQVPPGATSGKVVLTAFFQKSNSKIFTVK